MEWKGILFDFDGVIADTEPLNAAYLGAALRRFDIELTPETYRKLVGTSDQTTIRSLLSSAEHPVSMEELAAERRRCGNTYRNSPELVPQPGLRQWLAALRLRGVRTAVVSSTRTELIVTALNRMKLLTSFDVVACGDMVEHPKPAPDIYRLAMNWLELGPKQCLAIEDSPTGICAAKAAGLAVIGYTGGSIPQDVTQADWTAGTFTEISEMEIFQPE